MNIVIPQDVTNYILFFFFFSSHFEKIFCLSKFTTKSLKNMIQYKKYMRFLEKVNMMREDELKFIKNTSYEKEWFKYRAYKWPNVIKDICENKIEMEEIFKIGDFVDAKDFINGWCPAKIVSIDVQRHYSIDESTHRTIEKKMNVYEVEFFGWSSIFNEKMNYTKIRKLTTHTPHPTNKINILYRPDFEYFWCLIKKPDALIWNMSRVTDRIIDVSNIKITTNKSNTYVVTEKNIDDVILPISDASCFLANKTHTFEHTCRNFYL